MQISNILSKFSHNEKPQDFFLALEITSEFVVSAIWTVVEGKTKLVKVSQAKEWEGEEELILAVDNCLSLLLDGVSRKIKGVIFGLEESWVENNKIIPEKQITLRTLSEKMELKPLGFVVVTEALIQYLKITEGLPLSAILVKLEQTQSVISLVKMGRIVKTETVGRSDDLSADLKEALVRFGDIDSFPSRIILFDGLSDFEEARQQITSFDWPKELPFLHIPKVDILERNITIKALAIAGGSEIAKSLGFNITTEKQDKTSSDEIDLKSKDIASSSQTEPEVVPPPPPEDIVGQEPGIKKEADKAEETLDKDYQSNAEQLKELGFVDGEDVLEKVQNVVVPDVAAVSSAGFGQNKKEPEMKLKETIDGRVKTAGEKISFKKITSGAKTFLTGFLLKKSWGIVVLPIALLILLFTGGFIFYWYGTKADIVLSLEQKKLDQEITITGDKTIGQVDIVSQLLPIDEKTVTVSGAKTIDTTGTTLVGDKAEGRVVIYNKTEVTKLFAKDTSLVAENGLKFYLDEEVEVASRSAESTAEGEQIIYGKTEAKIIAAKIGPEFNLKKDTEFSVQEYAKSNFLAKAIDDFGGGSSREVAAVSSKDQEGLLAELKAELITKAKNDFGKENANQQVFSNSEEAKIIDSKYDKEIGGEGDALTLTLELEVTNYLFSSENLNLLLMQNMQGTVPTDYVLEKIKIDEYDIGELTDDGQVKIRTKVSAILLPKIDIDELKKQIKGKYPSVVQDFFATLPGFKSSNIKIYPSFLPSKLKTLPRQMEKINITIESML